MYRMKFCSADSIRVCISVALRYYFCSDKECVVVSWLSEYHTEPTVFTVRPVRSMRTVTPKPGDPRLFLLRWHRRDVDPSNAEDDMKPPRSSPAFISCSN